MPAGPRHPGSLGNKFRKNRRATARDDAFQLLEGLPDADSTLIRQSLIGFTMGHRP
jgi:hypothetical protein